jgi:hypothetical protein
MEQIKHGGLVRDKRSKDLYIFCGTATEEDHRKYNDAHPFYALSDDREEDWLLWSNRQHKFIFIAKSIAHLYIEPIELDKHTISVTENTQDAQN